MRINAAKTPHKGVFPCPDTGVRLMGAAGMTADFDCYKSDVKKRKLIHVGSF